TPTTTGAGTTAPTSSTWTTTSTAPPYGRRRTGPGGTARTTTAAAGRASSRGRTRAAARHGARSPPSGAGTGSGSGHVESSLHRFVRLLRLAGMRVSVSEAADAMHAAAQPGLLADRDALREALRVTLVKDRRDDEIFTELYDAFFALRRVTFGGGDEE